MHHRAGPGRADDPRRRRRGLAADAAAGAARRLGDRMPHQRRGSVSQLPSQHRQAGALCASAADHGRRRHRALERRSGRHRRARGWRDTDVLRLDDRQADRARARPRAGDRDDARRAQWLRDPRRLEQHRFSVCAAGAPGLCRWRLQHRIHRAALRRWLFGRAGGARRPRLHARAGGFCATQVARTRAQHQRTAARLRRPDRQGLHRHRAGIGRSACLPPGACRRVRR